MGRKLAEFLNTIFGFRKFILMLLLFAIGIVFRVKGFINGSEFVDLLKETSVAFFAANGLEHITNTVKDYIASKGEKAVAAEVTVEGPAAVDPEEKA